MPLRRVCRRSGGHGPVAVPETITFKDSGYTVIRKQNMVLSLDHGPLGMAPLYGHGHADALSVTLSYNGTPILIDPGTYRYNGVPEWRRYFKSTRAHNTVTIDGMDQANQASGFIWTKPYECKVVDRKNNRDSFFIKATHDGYCRLKSPVRHFRSINFLTPDTFLIQDSFSGKGDHEFELNYHLGNSDKIEMHDGWWQLSFGSMKVYIKAFESVKGQIVKGQTDPPFGWHSPAYNIKYPSNVLSFKQVGFPQNVRFTTAIVIAS